MKCGLRHMAWCAVLLVAGIFIAVAILLGRKLE